MNIKEFIDIIPIYIIILFSGLAVSVVIPILTNLDKNYHLLGTYILSKSLVFSIGSLEGVAIFISTISLIYWGYKADKTPRKPLLISGLVLFLIGDILILIQPQNIVYYIIGRVFFMGIGLGSLGPASYSYLGDLLSFEKRSQINSTFSIIGIGGTGLGILLSGILSNYYLFLPFIVLLFLAILLVLILLIYPEPIRGKEEPEIKQILDLNSKSEIKVKELEDTYSHNITLSSVKLVLKRKTNIFVLIQGFFALLPSIMFSYYLISYLHDTKFGGVGISLTIATLLGLGFASGRIFGYPFFGWLGDKLQFSTNESFKNKGRALIPTITMFAEAPFMIGAFLIVQPEFNGIAQTFPSFLFADPQLLLFGLLFFIGAFIGGGSGPNRASIMFDVNEPELRAQTASIIAIGDQIGASIGLIIGYTFIVAFGYAHAFAILSFGYIISGLFWFGAYKSVEKDEQELRANIDQRILSLQK